MGALLTSTTTLVGFAEHCTVCGQQEHACWVRSCTAWGASTECLVSKRLQMHHGCCNSWPQKGTTSNPSPLGVCSSTLPVTLAMQPITKCPRTCLLVHSIPAVALALSRKLPSQRPLPPSICIPLSMTAVLADLHFCLNMQPVIHAPVYCSSSGSCHAALAMLTTSLTWRSHIPSLGPKACIISGSCHLQSPWLATTSEQRFSQSRQPKTCGRLLAGTAGSWCPLTAQHAQVGRVDALGGLGRDSISGKAPIQDRTFHDAAAARQPSAWACPCTSSLPLAWLGRHYHNELAVLCGMPERYAALVSLRTDCWCFCG